VSHVVDLVMMSNAMTPDLASMTQLAVTTAVDNADNPINVTVMEQCAGVTYKFANTIHMPGLFNYNRFANRGAKMGEAPWIVFANNDLRFEAHWDKHLIKANHPVVSPYSPGYHRHYNVLYNERGTQVGRHLAGWCFMMARWLWQELGGLDETYPFWCADNAVMDQLVAKGVQPLLVRDSVVHHMVSSTLSRRNVAEQDRLTWAAVHQYNRETGKNILAHDVRYLDWKKRNGIR
jgi:hypothetical protein